MTFFKRSLTTLITSLLFPLTASFTFTITNNCPFTIWPGTLSGSGTPQLSTTGFQLDSGKSAKLQAVPGWSGRMWARTGCKFDGNGAGRCETGDCGGKLECDGSGATPPASLFEITLGKGDDKDFYDVSFVDGYNLPLVAWPVGLSDHCNATGCVSDINIGCPKELQVVGGEEREGGVIACKSACEAFGQDQYCCSGEYANPTTCKPSYYSNVFKRACPRAYSYAFDDASSTFTCKAFNYVIAFCPSPKKSNRDTYGSPPSNMYNPPPSNEYTSPPTGVYNSPPPAGFYTSPPSSMYNSPPLGGYNSPPSGMYNLSPSGVYSSPPSGMDDSPPSIGYGSPPNTDGGEYNSPPNSGDNRPSGGYSAPPTFMYNSPPFTKHSYGAAEGEMSSSNIVLPFLPSILLIFFSLLLLS